MASFNKIHATDYEHYCIKYHQENYENQITYHWSNIPEMFLQESGFITDSNKTRMQRMLDKKNGKINSIQEYGLDGMSKEMINGKPSYSGLQMKLYERTLTGNDLGTYWQVILCRLFIKSKLARGHLYHSSKLEINLSDDIKNTDGIITSTQIKNPFLKNAIVSKTKLEKDFVLKDYQKEAIKILNKTLWFGIRLLNIPCGMGKTVICAHHLKDTDYKTILMASPLKIHAKQLLDRVKQFLPNHKTLLLDSDTGGSRDFKDIEKIIKGKSLISATYKSAEDLFGQLFNDEESDDDSDSDTDSDDSECDSDADSECDSDADDKPKYDLSNSLLIIDEAHNLMNNAKFIKLIKKFPKTLLMTATPPANMDDIIGCKTIYKYDMKPAIENKHICGYKFYLPVIEGKEVSIEIPKELKKLDDDLCKKGLFIINGMLKTGSRRCIVFLTNTEEYEGFKSAVKEIMDKYHGLPYWINFIFSDTTQKNREQILSDFQKKEDRLDTIKFLCAVRILDEGVDIIKCDSNFITKIGDHTSDIRTLQRICRSNRIDEENVNKVASCFVWCDDLNKTVNMLQLLKNNDIDFNKKICVINSNYDKENTVETIAIVQKQNMDLTKFINIKCKSFEEMWTDKKELLFKFCDDNKRCIRSQELYGDYKLGAWLNSQNRQILSSSSERYIALSKNVYVKKSLDAMLKTREDNIDNIKMTKEEKLVLLFDFCDKTERVPYTNEKYMGCKIGAFYKRFKRKISNEKDKIYITLSKNLTIKKSLDNIILAKSKIKAPRKKPKSKDAWKKILFEYCVEYKSVPAKLTIYEDENIGSWFTDMKAKISSPTDEIYKFLSENKTVKDSLDACILKKQNNKHKKILTQEEKKIIVFEWCNKNKKIPIKSIKYKNVLLRVWIINKLRYVTNINDDNYKMLSENKIIKDYVDEYLKKYK